MTLDLIDKKSAALIIIDKQRGYFDRTQPLFKLLRTNSVIPRSLVSRIDDFIKRCRAAGLPIIWTQMIEDPQMSPQNISTKMELSHTPSISRPDEDTFDFYGIGPEIEDKVIIKKYYDAFAQTDLGSYLKLTGIKTVVLVGGYASRCVLATAFGANSHGYNVFVVKELVGVPKIMSRELPVALGIINSILGYVISEKEVFKAID